MNTVLSFLVPLFCWISHGLTEGLSPAKNVRRFQRRWFNRRSKANDPAGGSSGAMAQYPLRLKWRERDSFFDPMVQAVLSERQPAQRTFGKTGFKGYAVDAWQVVDQFARTLGRSERALAEFGVFMRLDAVWISKLLSAVTMAQDRRERSASVLPKDLDTENQRREQIMREWAECWIAHYRLQPRDAECVTPPSSSCRGSDDGRSRLAGG